MSRTVLGKVPRSLKKINDSLAHSNVVSHVKTLSGLLAINFNENKTRKHQNLTITSVNSVFRNSVNKAEQDLPVTQKATRAKTATPQSRRAGETSQENQQLRLQRRRDQKRARLECETPEQSELRRQAQRRRSQEQTADTLESCENQERGEQRQARLEPTGLFPRTGYFASEDAKVLAKSLLTQRRTVNFQDIQALISGFNMKAFPLLAEVFNLLVSQNIGKFVNVISRIEV